MLPVVFKIFERILQKEMNLHVERFLSRFSMDVVKDVAYIANTAITNREMENQIRQQRICWCNTDGSLEGI